MAKSRTPQSNEPEDAEPVDTEAIDTESVGTERDSTETAQARGFVRRHPLGSAIAAGVMAVVLISGLTSWGVGAAVTASLTSSTSGAAISSTTSGVNHPKAPATGPSVGPRGLQGNRVAFRGIISTIAGNVWTVTTMKGGTITVAINSMTKFGRPTAPSAQSDFSTGDAVIVMAPKSTAHTATTITAARVVAAKGMSTPTPSTSPIPGA